MTTLSQEIPFVFHLNSGTNDQFDFLDFIRFLVEKGHLASGDYLVMDNCGIHAAEATAPGVKLAFLPSYSPELNPCELVFAAVKNYLRNHRGPEAFWREITFALSTTMSFLEMWNVYCDCIWKDILE
jgi:transposase